MESLAPDGTVTNEPAIVACGAPDYIITRKNIPIGYVEAKDIGSDLNSKTYKEESTPKSKSFCFQLFLPPTPERGTIENQQV